MHINIYIYIYQLEPRPCKIAADNCSPATLKARLLTSLLLLSLVVVVVVVVCVHYYIEESSFTDTGSN